jgi:hypothetical protein
MFHLEQILFQPLLDLAEVIFILFLTFFTFSKSWYNYIKVMILNVGYNNRLNF